MAQNEIVRNVQCLADAVRAAAERYALTSKALVEHYPKRYDPCGLEPPLGRVFAYQFFDRRGGNCGYYIPDMRSVHFFATPRRWGMPQMHWEPIEQFANLAS